MANSYVEYTISNTSQTAYSFNKDFLLTSHIKVYYNGTEWTVAGGQLLSITGSSGAATITLDSSVIPTDSGAILKIARVTPQTNANRLVDWTSGSAITAADLDTAFLQPQYIAEEVDDNHVSSVFTATVGATTNANTVITETETIFDLTQAYSIFSEANPFTVDTTLDCIKVIRPCKVMIDVRLRMAHTGDNNDHTGNVRLKYATAPANKAAIMAGTVAWSETLMIEPPSSNKEVSVFLSRTFALDCSAATTVAPICFAVSMYGSSASDMYIRALEISAHTI
jgi:hypothetical protein